MHKKISFLVTALMISQQASAMKGLKEFDMEHQLIDFSYGKRVDPQHRLTEHAHDQKFLYNLSQAILKSSFDTFHKLIAQFRNENKIQTLEQPFSELVNTNEVVIANLQYEKESLTNRMWMLGSGATTLLCSGCCSFLSLGSLKSGYNFFIKNKECLPDTDDKIKAGLLTLVAIPSLYGLYAGGKKVHNGLNYQDFIGNKLLENRKIRSLLGRAFDDKLEYPHDFK